MSITGRDKALAEATTGPGLGILEVDAISVLRILVKGSKTRKLSIKLVKI